MSLRSVKVRPLLVALVIGIPTLIVAACSGGQHPVIPIPAKFPQSSVHSLANSGQTDQTLTDEDTTNGPLVTVTASVVVTVPSSASATKSISIKVNNETSVIANLSSSSPGCIGSNPLVCTVSVSAPTSSDVFAFKTFSGSNGTGTVLATGSVFQKITMTSTTINITLAGTPSAITLALKKTGPFECNGSATIQLFVMVMDSAANIIIGGYGESVSLTDSDTSGNTSLTLTSVSSSASTVNVKYNGNPIAKAIFSASASGVPPRAVHAATLKPTQLIFVSTWEDQANFVYVFPLTANGNEAPRRSMRDANNEPGNGDRYSIAVDSVCKLHVISPTFAEITEYSASASGVVSPTTIITGSNTQLSQSITDIAVDLTGKIYVATGSPAVLVFAAGSNGNVAPTAVISGANTNLQNPTGIAIDASSKIYIADRTAQDVLVFAAGATGNASPIATIGGSATTLVSPLDVTLDSANRIYVYDPSVPEIAVFPAGANGNVAPTRLITGSNTLLNGNFGNFGGIAADSAGNIYIANAPSTGGVNVVLVFSSSANGNVSPRQVVSGSNVGINFPADIAL